MDWRNILRTLPQINCIGSWAFYNNSCNSFKKYEPQKFVVNLGYLAIFVVILQGVLGGLTVLFLLPPAISISHATLAQTFYVSQLRLHFYFIFWKEERLNFNIEVGKNIIDLQF